MCKKQTKIICCNTSVLNIKVLTTKVSQESTLSEKIYIIYRYFETPDLENFDTQYMDQKRKN